MTNSLSKILIVGPAWVGDMVMAQSLFKVLKQRNPHIIIDVLAPSWSADLLKRMPEVNKIWSSPFKHGEFKWRERYRLGKSLRTEHYQQTIIIPNSFKSALIPFWAKIPVRTGWRGEQRYFLLNDARKLNKKQLPATVERYIALSLAPHEDLPKPLPWPQLKTSATSVADSLQKHQLTLNEQRILALCPGAEWGPSKRWPAAYFAEVAKTKLTEGWRVWLFGSSKDVAIAEEVQEASNNACVNLVGKTSLEAAIDLLSLATAVVSNDSGLMHIAAALNRPVVVIYGATPHDFTPPLSQQAISLWLDLECSPCRQRQCRYGHYRCLRDLHPQRVLFAIDKLVSP